jgi:TetR/AcrR family transcriptional regulator, lmrAB and yxaGH operons repressor
MVTADYADMHSEARRSIKMAGEVRARMVDGAIKLLASRGLEGTSFSEVLELTGTPRGSVYHHFPGGKDELVSAAVEGALRRALDLMATKDGAPAVEVAEYFLGAWRQTLTGSGFRAGCALVAVAVATESAKLREQTADAFRRWHDHLAGLLERGGLPAAAANRHAALLLAACEGIVIISRSLGDLSAFDSAASLLIDGVRRDTTVR